MPLRWTTATTRSIDTQSRLGAGTISGESSGRPGMDWGGGGAETQETLEEERGELGEERGELGEVASSGE